VETSIQTLESTFQLSNEIGVYQRFCIVRKYSLHLMEVEFLPRSQKTLQWQG